MTKDESTKYTHEDNDKNRTDASRFNQFTQLYPQKLAEHERESARKMQGR